MRKKQTTILLQFLLLARYVPTAAKRSTCIWDQWK